MIAVLMNWIYMLITTLICGWGFVKILQRIVVVKIKSIEGFIAIGFMLVTWYAQAFSIFYKVCSLANLLLCCVCVACVISFRTSFVKDFRECVQKYNGKKGIIVISLIVIWAYLTSRGYMHYDSDLYHAQSIRWIEEYGVVKGLGQIHLRFGYNSSLFAVSALYSMKFLLGQSLHAVNGFLAVVLSVSALNIVDAWKRKKFRLSDFAKMGSIYYLCIICDEIVSPASDYTIMCIVFFIIIKWLELIEEQEKDIAPYALLCVGGMFAVTVKVTVGFLLLLTIKPAIMLIQQKRWKEIVIYISLGILMLLPWMTRTVIITGYLLYPFPAIDLFSFDWKIDKSIVEMDATEIKVWGRALYDKTLVGLSIKEWFPNWFQHTLGITEKLIVVADLLCCVISFIQMCYIVIMKKREQFDVVLVVVSVMTSYLFWQYNAPILRYGYAYALLLPILIFGQILCHMNRQKWIAYGIIGFGIWKTIAIGKYAYTLIEQPYYVKQQDYGSYEVVPFEIDGVTLYYSKTGDRTGYQYFPSIPMYEELELRGESIEEGFRRVIQ